MCYGSPVIQTVVTDSKPSDSSALVPAGLDLLRHI